MSAGPEHPLTVAEALRALGHEPPEGEEYVRLVRALARMTDADIDRIVAEAER